jgi:hypothetical protein
LRNRAKIRALQWAMKFFPEIPEIDSWRFSFRFPFRETVKGITVTQDLDYKRAHFEPSFKAFDASAFGVLRAIQEKFEKIDDLSENFNKSRSAFQCQKAPYKNQCRIKVSFQVMCLRCRREFEFRRNILNPCKALSKKTASKKTT